MTHGIRKVNEYLISNGRALIFTDNIDFSSNGDLGMNINTNTMSGDVITLKIKDKYTPGELMKKLKNNRYSCR